MPLTTAGAELIASVVTGGTETLYTNANAHLGVGDGTTAFSVSQTDLAGTNKTRKPMSSAYPTAVGAIMTFRSVFDTGDANFAWEEWGIFNGSSAGEMLLREVVNLGTKTSAQSWQLTAIVTVTPVV